MKTKTYLLLLSFILPFVSHTLLADENAGKWQEKMQSLAALMGELLPELVSKNSDPKILEKDAKALSEISHSLLEGRKSGKLVPPSDQDPSVTFIAERFSEDAKFAYLAVQRGQLEYAKNYLRSITTYCIACHTRHENGPQFTDFPLNPKTEKLSPSEKAELYVATRQFDKGLAEFQSLIQNETFAKTEPFQWERPMRQALAIAVRVKNDPKLAEQTIDGAMKLQGLPEFEKANLIKWKASVVAWKKEPKTSRTSEAALLAEMKRLMNRAKIGQEYRLDRSSEIEYLRASGAAHDLLRVAKNPKVKAEALLTIGMAYEVLSNTVFWPMHDLWYEACVRELPHSAIAESCYHRYEESVYFGYTGSAGTSIPEEVAKRLKETKALAVSTSP